MMPEDEYILDIDVETGFLAEHSDIEHQQYAFYYTISIRNCSARALQLLRRYWLITDGNGEENEVSGEGVVGQQPLIEPQQTFSYTSRALIPTEVGVMQGEYVLVDPDGNEFSAEVPMFRLSLPNKVH